jgi:DNA modification methylase
VLAAQWKADVTVTILKGDCRDVLATLPAESVHCVVTSPPYFGLRDYGVAGQIGLEDFASYIKNLVNVFGECRRVLRKDGTLWLNLGDSYNSIGHKKSGSGYGTTGLAGGIAQEHTPLQRENTLPGLKHKDLCGIPWRVAMALQADDWWLRQDIIWSKPNPMPESVRDRCTKAHEYLFLLSKSERYHYDADAIAESSITNDPRRPYTSEGAWEMDGRPPEQRHGGEPRSFKGSKFNQGKTAEHQLGRSSSKPRAAVADAPWEKRNRRSVWTVSTQPYTEAHFATFPPALIQPCILAGCPKGGTVLDPFGGAGTTGLVADRLGRNAILIELNPDYADMAERRIRGDAGMFAEVAT